jgi:D-glycerate 3-kinase
MWFKQTNKSDVVLLEGWMAGFVPTAVSRSGGGGGGGSGGGGGGSGDDARGSLREIDGMLSAYDAWHQQMDAWVVVEIDELEHVYQWRMEAEHAMKASGRDGMSDDEVREM